MMQVEIWVKRLFHFNIAQVGLNSVLLFLLATWYIGLPSEEDANPSLYPSESSNPALLSGSTGSGDLALDDLPPVGSGNDNGPPPSAAAPAVEDAGPPTGPPPGSGSDGAAPGLQAPPIPSNAVAKYINEATQKMKALGEEKGVDISPYIPTLQEVTAAAGTGDFFNAKTLVVLRKIKGGYGALQTKMPEIPDGTDGPKPFEP